MNSSRSSSVKDDSIVLIWTRLKGKIREAKYLEGYSQELVRCECELDKVSHKFITNPVPVINGNAFWVSRRLSFGVSEYAFLYYSTPSHLLH